MNEFTIPSPSPEEQIQYAKRQSVLNWEKNPSPTMNSAATSLQKLTRRSPIFLCTETDLKTPKEGIYYAPEFADFQLVKIGQKRGTEEWLSRGSSAHEVTFGIIEARHESNLVDLNVAVKPFTTIAAALREAQNNIAILERGIRSTHPVAVIADNQTSFLCTQARSGVQSLDTQPWHQMLVSSERTRNHFLHLLFMVADQMSRLHSLGINHGDAQVKNFWLTEHGHIEAMDWEAATLHTEYPTGDTLLRIAKQDMIVLFESLSGHKNDFTTEVLTGVGSARWNQFHQYFMHYYLNNCIQLYEAGSSLSDEEILEHFIDDESNPLLSELHRELDV